VTSNRVRPRIWPHPLSGRRTVPETEATLPERERGFFVLKPRPGLAPASTQRPSCHWCSPPPDGGAPLRPARIQATIPALAARPPRAAVTSGHSPAPRLRCTQGPETFRQARRTRRAAARRPRALPVPHPGPAPRPRSPRRRTAWPSHLVALAATAFRLDAACVGATGTDAAPPPRIEQRPQSCHPTLLPKGRGATSGPASGRRLGGHSPAWERFQGGPHGEIPGPCIFGKGEHGDGTDARAV